jgi:hypothetical protein
MKASESRFCGSRYVTGLTEVVVRINLPEMRIGRGIAEEGDDRVLSDESPSYNAFTRVIWDLMKYACESSNSPQAGSRKQEAKPDLATD